MSFVSVFCREKNTRCKIYIFRSSHAYPHTTSLELLALAAAPVEYCNTIVHTGAFCSLEKKYFLCVHSRSYSIPAVPNYKYFCGQEGNYRSSEKGPFIVRRTALGDNFTLTKRLVDSLCERLWETPEQES